MVMRMCYSFRSFLFLGMAALLLAAISCETGQPPPATQPPNVLADENVAPSNSNPSDPAALGLDATAVLYQAKNGQGTLPGTVTWVNENVSAIDAHYLEGYSIPYRIVMNALPTDGTVIELVIGYDVKNSGKYAVSYLTHHQRLEPHVNTFGHPAEEINPLAGVVGVPTTADTIAVPAPRSNKLIDCLPGDLQQPSASFLTLSDDEKNISLYGGDFVGIEYEGAAPNLDLASAEERVKVRFTASSPTAVLTWGGFISSRNDFGCSNNPATAGGSFGSPFIARLKSWSLNDLTPQAVALSATTAIEPAIFCEVTGPMPVCPNSTDNIYSVAVVGNCEGPTFQLWHVLGDGVIVGSDQGPTVNVTAGPSGVFLVWATVFCLECHDCEPLFCCGVVNIVPPPKASAGLDVTTCPPASGPTCLTLAGSGSNGTPTWSIDPLSQNPGCEVIITNGNTFTPTVCFPESCSGSVTLLLTVDGECADATDSVKLTVSPASTADAGPDQAKCPVPSAATCFDLVGSGTNGAATWSVLSEPSPGSVTIQNGNTLTPTVCFGIGITGTATLQLTVAGEPPCPASDQVVLTVGIPASANAGPDASLCVSPSGTTCFQLAGSGVGGTPSWSVVTQPAGGLGCNVIIAGGNTFTPTVCFPAGCTGAATIQLKVSGDVNCRPSTDSIVLTVVSAPTASAGPDQAKCPVPNGETRFTLSGSGAGSAAWSVLMQPSPGSVTIQDGNSFTPTVCFGAGVLGSATLRLTVTGNELCPPATDDLVLTVGPSDLACQINTATAPGIFTGSISGGTAPYACAASFNTSGWILTDCQVNGAVFQVTYVRDGGICTPTPTVTVTITDSKGCMTECSEDIPCPQGCVAGSIIACECPDNPVWVCTTPSGGLPPFTYNWTGPGYFSDNTQCIMVNKPGVYTSTVTDGNGLSETCCAAVVDTHIHGPSPCPGATGLTYSAEFHFDEGTFTPISYSWSISGNGTFCGPTNGATVCVNAGNAGVFTLVTTVTGTLTFTCEGVTETIPISGTCALAYVVEAQNCH